MEFTVSIIRARGGMHPPVHLCSCLWYWFRYECAGLRAAFPTFSGCRTDINEEISLHPTIRLTTWISSSPDLLRLESIASRSILLADESRVPHHLGAAHADNGAFSLTIGPSRCLAWCRRNRAAQQHIGGSEEASDAPGHVPTPPSPHNLACSVPTQWQTHLRWQLWWTLSSVLVTNAEIIHSYPRKRLIMMHCHCCSHPRHYIAWSPATLTIQGL